MRLSTGSGEHLAPEQHSLRYARSGAIRNSPTDHGSIRTTRVPPLYLITRLSARNSNCAPQSSVSMPPCRRSLPLKLNSASARETRPQKTSTLGQARRTPNGDSGGLEKGKEVLCKMADINRVTTKRYESYKSTNPAAFPVAAPLNHFTNIQFIRS